MNKVKNGVYAVYRGQEYRAMLDGFSKNVVLFSEDPASSAAGFVSRHGKFEKEVPPAEVESLYDCTPYAMFAGVRVLVLTIKKDGVEFIYNGTKHASELRKLGFDQIDRYSYMKFVPESELPEILVEVSPMPGYKLPEDLD